MRRAYKSGATSSPPANDLTSVGHPTEGNAVDGTPSTILGPYWFYMVTEAIVRVIEDRSMTPNDTPSQFLVALKSLIDSRAANIDYATNSEAEQGAATDKIINPATLKHVIDLIDVGVTNIDYATNSEAEQGAATDKIINPATLKHVIDLIDVGVTNIDYATSTEARQGVATDKVINPATLKDVIDRLIAGAPDALDTLNELAAAIADDANYATTLTTALALKAPLISPALTGEPTAPTPASSDDSTKLATTEFVQNVAGRDAILASDIALAAGQDVTVDLSGSMADFRWLELLVGDNRNDYDLTPLKIERSLITDRVMTGGLYGLLQASEHGGAQLYEIDADTGQRRAVGGIHDFSTGTGTGLGMTYHNGKMYALAQTDNTARTALYEVHTETGTFTRIADGPVSTSTGGAIGLSLASHEGVLYALVNNYNQQYVTDASLYEVNTETWAFGLVSQIDRRTSIGRANFGLGMASHLGTLYVIGETWESGYLFLLGADTVPRFTPGGLGLDDVFTELGSLQTRDDFTFFGASLASHLGVLYASIQVDRAGHVALHRVDTDVPSITRIGSRYRPYAGTAPVASGQSLASNAAIGGGFTQGDWLLERVDGTSLGVRTSAAKHIHQIVGIR